MARRSIGRGWLWLGWLPCLGWLGAAGCAGDEPTATSDATACEGAGDPAVEVGEGGQLGFTGWADGDTVAIEDDGTGRYGFYADLWTTGLDTTGSVSTFLRFTIGDDPATTDVGATLTLVCTDDGHGWYGVFAPLDDGLQDAAAVAALDGLALGLSASLTDQGGETGSVARTLTLAAP
ncbi:MAG: hypothetical protein ABMB14_22240 [Myxococcota bacterium]